MPFSASASDDTVTVIVNHSEMGQGVYTALPMLVAEELEADWSKIRIAAAPVDPVYNHSVFGMQATGGSTSTWSEWERLRQAGAHGQSHAHRRGRPDAGRLTRRAAGPKMVRSFTTPRAKTILRSIGPKSLKPAAAGNRRLKRLQKFPPDRPTHPASRYARQG